MTTTILALGNQIMAQIEAKKKQIRSLENGKILTVGIRFFNTDKTEYEDATVTTGLPTGKIKDILLETYKADLANLERNFETLGN